MNSRSRRALAGAAACAAAFTALLSATYWWPRFERLDAGALSGFTGIDRLKGLCGVAVQLADPLPLIVLLAAVCAAGLAWGRRRQVLAAVAMVVGANLAAQLLKLTLAHPRVHQLLGPGQPAPNAFPSGHATAAMSLALAAVLVAPRPWRPEAALAGAALSLSVSFSVLVLGWHFPSDAVGGCIVAAGFGMLALAGLRAFEQGSADPRRTWPGLAVRLRLPAPLRLAAGVAAAVSCVVALDHAHGLLAYAHLHPSSVLAALGIAVASAVLVAAVSSEADGI